jgi:hypothetical protein
MAQQLGHLFQHIREAGAGDGGVEAVDGARGPGHQIQDEANVALQQLQATKAPRRLGDGLQEGQDGLAIGGARQLPDGLGDQFQAALPQLGGDPGHLLQIDQHGLEAAPDHADQGGPGEIGLDALGGQAVGRVHHAAGEDLLQLGEVTGQALAVALERIVDIGHVDVPECRLGSCRACRCPCQIARDQTPKMASMAWSRVARMSASSVMGRTRAMRQAGPGATPRRMSRPA